MNLKSRYTSALCNVMQLSSRKVFSSVYVGMEGPEGEREVACKIFPLFCDVFTHTHTHRDMYTQKPHKYTCTGRKRRKDIWSDAQKSTQEVLEVKRARRETFYFTPYLHFSTVQIFSIIVKKKTNYILCLACNRRRSQT